MTDEVTTDSKISNDEKSSTLGKLESMTKEELIKLVKTQIIHRKKLEIKLNELTKTTQNENNEEQKIQQSKLQDELNIANESLENLRVENEKLKTSCQNLQDELSSLKIVSEKCDLLVNLISIVIDSFQLPISIPDSIDQDFLINVKNELEQKQDNYKQTFEQYEQDKVEYQQRIEDLEFFNEEIKLEIDDLKLKSQNYQHDKHILEKEIGNYRRQIEDFEEQFLELQRESYHEKSDKSQQQPSITSSLITLNQIDENHDEISSQCINDLLNQIDNNHQNRCLTKSSSTSSLLLSSDIPTLLHSIGITNCTDEEFTIPLNFESVIHLCTLLIERCRVLQYILLKNNDISLNSSIADHNFNHDCVFFSQEKNSELCKIFIHKHDHIALDTLFQRIYYGMNQTINSNESQIIIEKIINQNTSPSIRLSFDNFKFVSEEIEHELISLRSEYEQLLQENEKQRSEIILLEKSLHTNNSYEQLKEHQTKLEEQLSQQCEKTIQLENILQQANIDKTKFDQLNQIQYSYNELLEKYHIAAKLEEQLKESNDLYNKLKVDYDRQHLYLLEREENIRLLKLEIEENENFQKDLMEKSQNQIKHLENEFEKQKNLLLNSTQNNDERYVLLSKKYDELNNLIQIKITENQNLFEQNLQLENNLKENQENLQEKTQQIDQLNKQFDNLQIEYDELQINFNQIKDEKNKLVNEINLLMNNNNNNNINHMNEQIVQKENEKLHQTINELNEKIQKQNSDPGENIQELKEKYQKMKILLTRLKKELQEKPYQPKQSLIDLELADYEKTIQNLKDQLNNKDKDLQDIRDELTNSIEKYNCLKIEIQNLEQQKIQNEERANKFKTLLDVAKKELQNAKDRELQRYENDDNQQSTIEKLQKQLEKNKILINDLINDKQQLTEKFTNHNETTQKSINLLEQNLRIAKHELDIAKQDYDTLQDDFNSYKIRAQSVLKQHQSNQRERTPSIADKQMEFEETIEKLKTNLQEANNKIELLNSENEALQKEQDRLSGIQTKLINESKKREQDLRKQHQIEIDKIQHEYSQQIHHNDDILKNLTLQNETMSIAYKEQIATIETDHQHELTKLKKQCETSEEEVEQLKIHIQYLQQINSNHEKLLTNSETLQIGIKNDFNRDNTLAWSDNEHQQGEKTTSKNIKNESLNDTQKTPENHPPDISSTIQNTTTIPSSPSDKHNHISIENNEIERQLIEEELKTTKIRLMDTVELLNESELNNQRLNEQVTLLKDEIRRLERNMDRAESISNLEYLKNIILKFFILKSTPERLQLIPVLVTMLKLSPDEQAQLVRVANISTIIDENTKTDESPSQQMTNGATSPSWSSYLNIW